MSRTLLLTWLALSVACLSLVPAASADHCAQYPPNQEVRCEAFHAAGSVGDFVFCFYDTAPSQWLRDCIALTTGEGAAPVLP